MTITDVKYFREHSDVVQVAAYALHDVLHALKNDNCECLVSKEDGHLVVHYCQKRPKSTDDKSIPCTDGNSEEKLVISKSQFDSLVSYVLEEFPDASLIERDGHSMIDYHGRQFDLESDYFLSVRPDFVRLLEQDMRSHDKFIDYSHNIGEPMIDLHGRNELTQTIAQAACKFNENGEPIIDLRDWNDASSTKIPLNEELFALLEDRMNPEKLRPAVILAKMEPAKTLSWSETKEGDALCYDDLAGNFHSCNGADIKYWKPVWKHVNVPSSKEPR